LSSVVVVGAGVVGQAWGGALDELGHHVSYVDTDPTVRAALAGSGREVTAAPTFGDTPTTVFLCVPTPKGTEGYDDGPLRAATEALGAALLLAREGGADATHTIVVRSTVTPGTTEAVVGAGLEAITGLRAGEGFHLAVMPEYLRQDHADDDARRPLVTVIASTSPAARADLAALVAPLGGEVHLLDDLAAAELAKCAHNAYNAAKIAFWNDLWRLGAATSADLPTVAELVSRTAQASWDPTYGTRGGRPYEGACLPKDVKALLAWSVARGARLDVLGAVDALNDQLLADRARAELAER
jgi:UDPglucose 6-dehydrogenase